jgi:hypothetical protein
MRDHSVTYYQATFSALADPTRRADVITLLPPKGKR